MQARHLSRSSKNSERNYKTRRFAAAHAAGQYRGSSFPSELRRTSVTEKPATKNVGAAQQQKT
jgi:hypothetical protein